MLRGSTEKGEGYKRRGFLAAAPSLSLQFRLAQLRLFLVFPTCAHWRVRSFSPLSPGEKGGPRKESGGRGAGRGADAPRGPPTGALGVRRARAFRHPLLSSPLFSGALPDRRGCNPHSCGGARVLRTSPRAARIPEPLTAAAGAQQQRRHQGPHLRAVAGGSPPQVSGAATASAIFRGTTSEQRRSSDRLKRPPRLLGCARARIRRPEPAPTPRELASRARALRPAWPPLLVDVTPSSNPGSGQAPAET